MPKTISRIVCLSSEVQELSFCLAMTSILSCVLFPFVRSWSRLASNPIQLGPRIEGSHHDDRERRYINGAVCGLQDSVECHF
ncbi:hypothetical protein BDV39DRAFT_171439 [Aspergillus sergii]|uniref:Uncharacterized protein n=1 Tax=Aspergillus sergii TaxID=1034303 RepID=A0A5N6XAH0_9EURO|nr:hypothetical protein BDV39DRAFT_171439 [Aspergillus sergii]